MSSVTFRAAARNKKRSADHATPYFSLAFEQEFQKRDIHYDEDKRIGLIAS